MLPPMRCQHYFDDGQPIHDGCHYKHDCKFVHPQHAEWGQAMKPIVQRERIYGQRDFSRGPLPDFVVEKGPSHRAQQQHSRGRSPSPTTPPSRGRFPPPGAGHRRDDSWASSSKASVDHSRDRERERRREHDADYGNGDPGASGSGSRSKGKLMDVDASPITRRPDDERPRTLQRDQSLSRVEPLSPPPPPPPTTTTAARGSMTASPRSPRVAPSTAPRWQRSQDPRIYSPPLSLNAASASPAMPAPPASAPLPRRASAVPQPPLPLSSAPPLPPPPHSAPILSLSQPAPKELKPLGPLPPVPDLPSALQLNKESVLGPPPMLEDASKREKLWDERIKLLAESVLSHETIQALQEDQDTAQKILGSTLVSTLDPAARARLVAQNTELQARLDAERTAHRRQRDLLVHQMFWPVAPPRKVSREEEQQYVEMRGYVRELNSEVMGMKELLGEIEEIKKAAEAAAVGKDKGKGKEQALDVADGGDEGAIEGMPVDDDGDVSMSGTAALPQASGTSSRKRRRLASGAAASTRVTDDPASPDYIPTAAELDNLRELLAKCSHEISDLQNEVTRAGNDWADTVKTTVEAELDAERARRAEEVEAREAGVREERERQKEGVRRRVEEVKKQVGELGGQVVEVTESLAGLVLTAGRLEEEVEVARRRREGAYERLGEIDVKMQSYKDAQARNVEAIATLRTALEAYLTQPPSPPVSPTFPSASSAPSSPASTTSTAALPPAAYILQSLQPQLTDVARATMRPLLEELRGEIQDVIQRNNAEMYRAFHEKMAKARQVVHAISQHLPHLAQAGAQGQGAAGPSGGGGVRAGGSVGPPGKAPSGTSTRTA